MQHDDIQRLTAAANAAAQAGRIGEARQLWAQVLARTPEHPTALFASAVLALQAKAPQQAISHLAHAIAGRPGDAVLRLTLSQALRDAGAPPEDELAALNDALTLDPYFLPALLSKGAYWERQGKTREAAQTYQNVIKIAPPPDKWPAEMRGHLAHAKAMADANLETLFQHVAAEVGDDGGARIAEGVAIMTGRSRPYHQEPVRFLVPRLPAIPFYDRADFPELAALEAETAAIRDELVAGLKDLDGFTPYVQYAAGAPVNQWAELNHSDRWSTLFLWKDGMPVEENQKRFPKTAAALAKLPMADMDGFCPTAMFSALAPHTHIPPHTGETNARLVVHLPLIVPPNCSYRVGAEWTAWREGACLIFDDSIEHEARNESDQLRIVLIFDLWNPHLTQAERGAVGRAMRALRDYYANG